MKVDLKLVDGRAYKVSFDHIKDSRKVYVEAAEDVNLFRVSSAVRCLVFGVPGGDRCGWAFCSRSDEFDPAKGRRKALANAIRRATRADRTLVWNAFNAQFPPDRESAARRLDSGWLGRLAKGPAR